MTRTLFTYWRSSAAYRVRIALAWKGLDYVSQPVDLRVAAQRAPDFLALNPQGLVPLLVEKGLRIAQSGAIIEYLEEVYPDPPLLPVDPAERAQVRAAVQLIACDIHPLNNLRVFNYLKEELGQSPDTVTAWAQHWIAAGFTALETQIQGAAGRYLFGESVTMADIFLVPQLYNARRMGLALDPFPRLLAVEAALLPLPAFQAAHPAAQADCEA